jgi:hypothetical protein
MFAGNVMADEVNTSEGAHQQPNSRPPESAASAEEQLAASLPPQERRQPDPALQLSVGRLGGGAIALVAVVAALILAVVFYGLNSAGPNAQDVGTPPKVAAAPQAGGAPGAPNAQPANKANHP